MAGARGSKDRFLGPKDEKVRKMLTIKPATANMASVTNTKTYVASLAFGLLAVLITDLSHKGDLQFLR
jgi:hypothetical protein